MAGRTGQQLGHYRLVRLLGRGGFAEVYLGEHLRLGTQAAVKVLHTSLEEDDIEGFLREAQTVARLKHPHIVRVFDFDVQDHIPFLVMDYLPNGNVRRSYPKGISLSLETIVSYVNQVASALQYAHDQKLIHRDVKPENMLLDQDNSIVLSDFGIALMAQSSRYQSTQQVAGTAAYMAPEQFQGHPHRASDQYALGIVVYEWLSGDRPFHGTFSEIASQHMFVSPLPLHEKVPDIATEIEQVVLTALEKDPKERFASVQAFAIALEQAIHSTLRGGKTTLRYYGHAAPVIDVAWSPDGKNIASASANIDDGVKIWNATTGDTVLTHDQWHGTMLFHDFRENVPEGDYSIPRLYALDWSPDGKRLVSVGGEIGTIEVIDATTGSLSAPKHPISKSTSIVSIVAWSPDGNSIVSTSYGQKVIIYDSNAEHQILTYQGHPYLVTTVAWSPDGKLIASGSSDHTVQIWDAQTGHTILTYRGHLGQVAAVAWSPDGKNIASASVDKTVHIWDAATGQIFLIYRGHNDQVAAVAWSPDGKLIASAGGHTIFTEEFLSVMRSDSIFSLLKEHYNNIYQIATLFQSAKGINGREISSRDCTVQIWNAMTGQTLFIYHGHTADVLAVAWSPDGKYIASASVDKTVQVWQAS